MSFLSALLHPFSVAVLAVRRPLLAAAMAVLAIGSVELYVAFVAGLPAEKPPPPPREAKGVFALELTVPFDAAPDTYALEPASVLVLFGGRELLRRDDVVPAGEPLVVTPIRGIVESQAGKGGRNEFFIKVSPESSSSSSRSSSSSSSWSLSSSSSSAAPPQLRQLARAARVRILRDGEPVAEQTLWSEPGWPVEGTVELTVHRKAIATQEGHH